MTEYPIEFAWDEAQNTVPFVAGELYGLRVFSLVERRRYLPPTAWLGADTILPQVSRLASRIPDLYSLSAPYTWKPGVNQAQCLRVDILRRVSLKKIFSGEKMRRGIAGSPPPSLYTGGGWSFSAAEAKNLHDENCSCGFYAYFSQDNTLISEMMLSGRVDSFLIGIVKAWGRITQGTKGFRSEFAEIVALALPPTLEEEQRKAIRSGFFSETVLRPVDVDYRDMAAAALAGFDSVDSMYKEIEKIAAYKVESYRDWNTRSFLFDAYKDDLYESSPTFREAYGASRFCSDEWQLRSYATQKAREQVYARVATEWNGVPIFGSYEDMLKQFPTKGIDANSV